MTEARRYERITIRPEGAKRSRTGWFRIISEGPALLLLEPVDEEGQDRSFIDGDGVVVEKQELVSVELVTRRQPARINNHYGTLEVAEAKRRRG